MDCDLSLFDTAISMLTYQATWYLKEGLTPERQNRSAHPSVVPFGLFPAADGWLVIACPKEKFFRRLLEALGIAEVGEDPRFRDFDARRRNAEALTEILDTCLAKNNVAHWIRALAAAGIPVAPINDVPAALADPQVEARGLIVETSHPRFESVRQIASPVRVGLEDFAHRRAPRLGEDQNYVLKSILGYDADRVMAFAKAGAFGTP
ncbi:MAG: hypothetical protein KatS3mg011_1748 [Acidimicrobiia bacterium]|nr:MAG: hypothetical protein KatS3mg011_1748 [Acidimicrobiia bacterium]